MYTATYLSASSNNTCRAEPEDVLAETNPSYSTSNPSTKFCLRRASKRQSTVGGGVAVGTGVGVGVSSGVGETPASAASPVHAARNVSIPRASKAIGNPVGHSLTITHLQRSCQYSSAEAAQGQAASSRGSSMDTRRHIAAGFIAWFPRSSLASLAHEGYQRG